MGSRMLAKNTIRIKKKWQIIYAKHPKIALLIVFLLGGMLWGLPLYYITNNLRISVTPSVNAFLFLKKKECSYERFECAEIEPPENDPNLPPVKGITLIKMFSCLPGETVEVKGLEYYCLQKDGIRRLMGKAKTVSRKGKPLTPWKPPRGNKYVLPEGYFFMVNPNKDSYDSRYLGPIPKRKIISCLQPIF